jgi:hypothetical protein
MDSMGWNKELTSVCGAKRMGFCGPGKGLYRFEDAMSK